MARIIGMHHTAQHLWQSLYLNKINQRTVIRNTNVQANTAPISFEFFKNVTQWLYANTMPSKLTFEKKGIAVSNAIMRTNIYKKTVFLIMKIMLIEVSILAYLAVVLSTRKKGN